MKFFRFCLLLLFFASFSNGYAQKEKSNIEIQVYGIPYYKLSNFCYDNLMQYQSDYFKLDYSERINQEMGLNVKYRLNKWKFGLGLSYNTFNYDHTFYMVDYDNFNWGGAWSLFHQEINLTTLGIGLMVEREIAKTINLGVRFSVNSTIKNQLANPTRGYIFQYGDLYLEETYKVDLETLLIPEVFVSKTIYKGLDLIAGYKLRFYERNGFLDETIYSIEVRSNYSQNNEVYSYKIDTYQVGFYFGASYTFQLPKLRQPKLD